MYEECGVRILTPRSSHLLLIYKNEVIKPSYFLFYEVKKPSSAVLYYDGETPLSPLYCDGMTPYFSLKYFEK